MSSVRYGVYLRPGAEFARVAAEAFSLMRAQFGLKEAACYPPHVTLVGSIAIDGEEHRLVDAVDAVLRERDAVWVFNSGLRIRPGDGVGYDLHRTPSGEGNQQLRSLACDLIEAVGRIRVYPATDWDVADRRHDGPDRFEAHLTVVGREVRDVPELRAEVLEFLRAAQLAGPEGFRGDTVTLYRLHAREWTADYWRTMQWEIVRSWRLS